MAPSVITEDYYMILEVDQTAGVELITKSYRQLARKLHPDRNPNRDATGAFQRVCLIRSHVNINASIVETSADLRQLLRAYETLKDENERRKYDLVYHSIRTNNNSTQTSSSSESQMEIEQISARIAALQKTKRERAAELWAKKTGLESTIFETKREIRRLEQSISELNSILAAEAAAEAQKNSWSTWLLSPLYKRVEESDEDRARKDRARQERRIEKDMKERRLSANKEEVESIETSMNALQAEKDAADAEDERWILAFQRVIWSKENAQRLKREKAERELRAHQMRQQQEQRERREREEAEMRRRQQAAEREAEQKRYEEQHQRRQEAMEEDARQWQEQFRHFLFAEGSSHQTHTTTCQHDGWWPKVQGYKACPRCSEGWTYLLQCPGCNMQACPRCQAAVRPRRRRNDRGRTSRIRTPSPNFDWDYY